MKPTNADTDAHTQPQPHPTGPSTTLVRGLRGGSAGVGVRGEISEFRTAVLAGYDITPEIRQRAVDAIASALTSANDRVRLAAIKGLAALEMLNLRRERLESDDRHQDNREAIARINLLISSPESRKLLEELTKRTLGKQVSHDGKQVSQAQEGTPPRAPEDEEGGRGGKDSGHI